MNEEEVKLLKENKPLKAATVEEVGIAWASDAVRDALTKSTPQECKFYLDALRVMALQLLANECFNTGLGLGAIRKNKADHLVWDRKAFIRSVGNINRSIESRVNTLIKMQKEGKLQKVDSVVQTPLEEAIDIAEAESNVVDIRGAKSENSN